MDKKIILMLCIVFVALFSARVLATTNTLSQSVWNETFITSGDHVFYVNLPKNSIVFQSKLDLTGYQSATDLNMVDSVGNNFTLAYDNDNDTYTGVPSQSVGTSNLTFANQIAGREWWIKFGCAIAGDYDVIYFYLYNFTNESWTNIQTAHNSCFDMDGAFYGVGIWINGILYGDFINSTNHTILSASFGVANNVWHTVLIGNDAFAPANPYLDVSDDESQEWNFTGDFNRTNVQTSDFSSEINSYLSTCTPINGTCDVPFILHIDSAGIIQVQLESFGLISFANVTITVNVGSYVTPYTVIKNNVTSVVNYSGSDKVISLLLDANQIYSVNVTGNQIHPFFGYFNATDGATFTATPRSSLTSTGNLLTDVGSGVGSFLSAITLGVTQIVIYIAIIMGVLSIVYAIAYVFKKFTGGGE